MIFDALTYLFYALVVVAFIQPNAPRFFAAVTFVSVTISHELFLSHYDGLAYYGSAALFDLGIIAITSGIRPVPKMVLSLHKICLASMVLNLVGWGLWFFYLPPVVYDASFVILYVWALLTFINRSGLDVGGYTMDSWASCFCFHRYTWGFNFHKHDGKI